MQEEFETAIRSGISSFWIRAHFLLSRRPHFRATNMATRPRSPFWGGWLLDPGSAAGPGDPG